MRASTLQLPAVQVQLAADRLSMLPDQRRVLAEEARDRRSRCSRPSREENVSSPLYISKAKIVSLAQEAISAALVRETLNVASRRLAIVREPNAISKWRNCLTAHQC